MAQLEERKVISPPPFAPSPTLPHPFHSEEVSIFLLVSMIRKYCRVCVCVCVCVLTSDNNKKIRAVLC